MDQAEIDLKASAVADANDNKQREVLDSVIGIRIEAEAMADRTKAVDHAIAETARVYEDAFVLEVSAEGCATEFMGAADRYIEQVNS